LKVLELFGGIGACTQALKRLGIDVEVVDYVEIDKYAVASYNAINGTNFEPQDICVWDKDIDVDLIMHGSPCQDISLAGQQAGADEGSGTRSSLMYETIRIVNKLKPKYIIWENVKNLISKKHRHNFDKYLEALSKQGYKNYWQVLNAKDYGIPQNRERVFTISIRNDIDKGFFYFPQKQELKLRLKDLLEDEVDEKYYISDKMKITLLADSGNWKISEKKYEINRQITRAINTREGCYRPDMSEYICNELPDNYNLLKVKNANSKGYDEAIEGDSIDLTYPNSTTRRGRVGHQVSQTIPASDTKGVVVGAYARDFGSKGKIQDKDYCDTLTASMGEGGGNVPLTNDLRIRKLTPKECWRLMGFSDEAFEKAQKVNSNTQLYKQAGNSIVVNVLEAIFKELLGGKNEKESI
jgi:DNA (cytosine-5)-methyltransferase 1